MKTCGWLTIVIGFSAGIAWPADRTWQAAGDGAWSEPANWAGSAVPGAADTAVFNNALTSDVVIDMDRPDQPVDSLALQNETAPWRRVFTGGQTVSNVFLFDAGEAWLRGEWNMAGSGKISWLGNAANSLARLVVDDGGRLTMTNASMIYIGKPNARGQLFIRDGAEVVITSPTDTASGLYIGREAGGIGSVVQHGGTLRMNIAFIPGYTGYGVYEMLNGEFIHPWAKSQTRYRIGMNGPGLVYLRGGSYAAGHGGAEPLDIARNTTSGSSPFGLVYADGGTATVSPTIRFLAQLAGSNLGYAELTVAGNASFSMNGGTMGSEASSKGKAVINLNERGVLHTTGITKAPSAQNTATVNFDGGTFASKSSGDMDVFASVDAVLYGGGAKLASSSGRIMLRETARVRGAQGNGVSELALTAGGSGYAAPPRVVLSGGGGSNATAVAFIDYGSGAVTGVVITCRGEGYASAPTVAFTDGGGSGAVASAAIAANVAGPLAFRGSSDTVVDRLSAFDGEVVAEQGRITLSTRNTTAPGMPHVSALRLNGGSVQVGSSGSADDCPYDDIVNPSARLIFGGDRGGGEYLQPCGPAGDPHIQNFAAMQINAGKGRVSVQSSSAGSGRSAELIASVLAREAGGTLAVSDATLASMKIATGALAFAGTLNPVLPGVIAGAAGFVTEAQDGSWMKLGAYDDDLFGTDMNFRMTSAVMTNTVSGLAVNSMHLPAKASLTLDSAGTTVVESGMIAVGAGAAGTVIAGGRLTSGNGSDLVVYDAQSSVERRNTVSVNNWTLNIGSMIVDNGGTPVAFVAAGPADVSSLLLSSGGMTVLTQATNEYSGGTFIIDAGLEAAEDRSLGAVPAVPGTNIVTSGMAVLRAKKNAWPLRLHENRGICLKGGCLALIGDDGATTVREIVVVNGPVSGKGVLVFNHWTGGCMASIITLAGDQSAFEGTYAVHGTLRLTGAAAIPPLANLALCENNSTSGDKIGGVVEMAGVFTHAPGTGAGQVQWCEANSLYPNLIGANDPAESGGFSAYGGPLTVNLGGDGRTLKLDQDGFNLNVLRLQTDAATHDLTWENGIDLMGRRNVTLQIARTSNSKYVYWRGPILNSGATRRTFFQRQQGKLVLCDGADVGDNLIVDIGNSLQCQITNRQTLACNFWGSGPITKWGEGVTVATGISTNSGMMRIYEGTWLANGSHTLAGNYMVSNNATLGGGGVIVPDTGNSVTVDGTLAAGSEDGACGTLTLGSMEQSTTLNLNGRLAAEVGTDACDLVAVFGDVAVGEGTMLDLAVADDAVWAMRRGERIPLLTWTGEYSGAALQVSGGALPKGWKLRTDTASKAVYLEYVALGMIFSIQ